MAGENSVTTRYVYQIRTLTQVSRTYEVVATDADEALEKLRQFNFEMLPISASSGPTRLDVVGIVAPVPDPPPDLDDDPNT